ncbi:MAG: hypothetical protein AAGJ89_18000, partial [Pseudomonadota bacterium]
ALSEPGVAGFDAAAVLCRIGQGPNWADVTARPFEPITAPRITLDTAGQSPDTTLTTLLSHLPHRTR